MVLKELMETIYVMKINSLKLKCVCSSGMVQFLLYTFLCDFQKASEYDWNVWYTYIKFSKNNFKVLY